MKIAVCDVCEHEGKLTKSRWKVGFKGVDKVDLCDEHKDSAPKDMVSFVKWKYQLAGVDITEEEAKKIARSRYS